MFLEGREPEPGMTIQVDKTIIPLCYVNQTRFSLQTPFYANGTINKASAVKLQTLC